MELSKARTEVFALWQCHEDTITPVIHKLARLKAVHIDFQKERERGEGVENKTPKQGVTDLPSQPSERTELPHQSSSISQTCRAKKMRMPLMAMAQENAAEVT